ncbi:glycosyltransferase family 2 protein [Priestia megaterium]|uniref:glycosyltransferase family 2 protein n=1 Tax=Priestia megaterium TaxID=1404 RepID=UPI0021D68C30|nr:glycosyltransferase [Priestia megaterium]MCU7741458.1 glycosyltransferase [Priestia megaterium]
MINTNSPKVSVIIPFYNCKYVHLAIESVLNQTYSNVELIVVNDGSTSYTELIWPYLDEIHYIEKENGGTASALNVGIENATGKYFCWLSADDLYDYKKIELQVQQMLEKDISISFTNFNTIDTSNTIIGANIAPEFATKLDFYKEFMKSCPINGCTIMIKMDVFKKVGLFNERYQYTHDYEFWMRLTEFFEFHYLNITLVSTRIHDGMGSITHSTEILQEVAELRKEYAPILNSIIEAEGNFHSMLSQAESYIEKVSIIIPFYNCSYIDQAIQSALNQTYKNVEVIVVNDGSTLYEEKITPYLNKIKYIIKENGGTASALNTGIRNATGEYFSWLSSDDIYALNKVEDQVKFMKSMNASVSYTPAIHINSESQPISESVGVKYSDRLHFIRGLKKGCTINGCTVMMKMNIFSEVGMFDESLPYVHDYDLWLRITPKYEFYYLDEPLVLYRIHDEMGTKMFMDKIIKEVKYVKEKHIPILDQLIFKEENENKNRK